MTKKRIFMMVTFLVMMVFTVSAYAVNYSGEGKKRGSVYNVKKEGSNSIFMAVGTQTQAYTTVSNKATYNAYMVASVQSYEHGKGVYTKVQDGKVVEPGYQLLSGNLTRKYTSDIYDFYHGGESYSTTTAISWSKVDTYSYKAKQYYE